MSHDRHRMARLCADLLLLVDPALQAKLTLEGCQRLIDQLEEDVPHDELPECYDWLVARRNQLRGD